MESSIIVGSTFANKTKLKVACHVLAIRENFEFIVVKSDHCRFIIKYLGETCPWHLHASIITDAEDGLFEVKTSNNEHNYLGVQHPGHRQASASFIAQIIQSKMRVNPNYRAKEIARHA